MANFLKAIQSFVKDSLFPKTKTGVYSTGPNNFAELLKQFDQPQKEKSKEDIIRNFQVQITMFNLEYEMLKMDPSIQYKGTQRWKDHEENVYFDWVPCIVRPEVVYCSFYKN